MPGNEGDPTEILLLAPGCFLETNVVFTLTNDVTGDFDENYMTLIAPQSATNSTYVDGTNKITNFVAVGTNGYYGAQIFIPMTNSGPHTVTSSQPVGMEVYGWGYTDAYGYFGGVVQ